MQNPVRGFLHGSAAVLSLVGLVFLIHRAWGSTPALIGGAVFGLALITMYTVSSLYHSIPWPRLWKRRLQRVDHSMIYLVVAGTFTPVAIASLEGATLGVVLGVVWTIGVVGIALKFFMPNIRTWLSVTLQLTMGWLAIFFIPQFYDALGLGGVLLIFLGGLSYTVGVIIFSSKRPLLWPRSFSYHELFHVLVIAGSAFHFATVFAYAIPATV